MLTLYVSGRRWGLPDASPFVCKAEALLKLSGLDFKTSPSNFRKAPKGKIPYLEDDGVLLGDSTFIRAHLERKYRIEFDSGLNARDKAVAWAFEKMCEEHLYWAIVHSRWSNDVNFNRGTREFFDIVPAPVRPFVVMMVRRQVRQALHGQGFGRHTTAEVVELARRDLESIAAFLGDKPWLMGQEPCGADAAVWATVAGTLCRQFDTPIRDAAEKHTSLVAYRDRGMARWFSDIKN